MYNQLHFSPAPSKLIYLAKDGRGVYRGEPMRLFLIRLHALWTVVMSLVCVMLLSPFARVGMYNCVMFLADLELYLDEYMSIYLAKRKVELQKRECKRLLKLCEKRFEKDLKAWHHKIDREHHKALHKRR